MIKQIGVEPGYESKLIDYQTSGLVLGLQTKKKYNFPKFPVKTNFMKFKFTVLFDPCLIKLTDCQIMLLKQEPFEIKSSVSPVYRKFSQISKILLISPAFRCQTFTTYN